MSEGWRRVYIKQGCVRGDVAAVMLPNIRAYVEAWLALASLGAVMTTLYMTFRSAELSQQLAHSRARMIIATPSVGEFEPLAWALEQGDALPHLSCAVAVGGPVAGALDFEALASSDGALPGRARGTDGRRSVPSALHIWHNVQPEGSAAEQSSDALERAPGSGGARHPRGRYHHVRGALRHTSMRSTRSRWLLRQVRRSPFSPCSRRRHSPKP